MSHFTFGAASDVDGFDGQNFRMHYNVNHTFIFDSHVVFFL